MDMLQVKVIFLGKSPSFETGKKLYRKWDFLEISSKGIQGKLLMNSWNGEDVSVNCDSLNLEFRIYLLNLNLMKKKLICSRPKPNSLIKTNLNLRN